MLFKRGLKRPHDQVCHSGYFMHVRISSTRRLLGVLTVAVWLILVGTGVSLLLAYSSTPGESGTEPGVWPRTASLDRELHRPTLVVFLHPRCPCSIAIIRDLARLKAAAGKQMSLRFVVYSPAEVPATWTDTEVVRMARRLKDAPLVWDVEGKLAQQFGARTSGHTLLYGSDGALRFSGGVTSIRGHEGPSAGMEAILNALTHPGADVVRTPVYGCKILTLDASAS